jgi:hypothetical protein
MPIERGTCTICTVPEHGKACATTSGQMVAAAGNRSNVELVELATRGTHMARSQTRQSRVAHKPVARKSRRKQSRPAHRGKRVRKWSRQVAERSDALDLEGGVFTSDDPRRIARSLKRSAEASTRRKARPFQSAMSMLNLYINRAGRKLPASRRRVLERAKDELRAVFGRPRS